MSMVMAILENGQAYSSPHLLRSSTVWGVGASEASRGRPLVECAGRAGRSRAPAAALRAGLRPPWTVRPVPGSGWLSGGPSLVAPVRRSGALWVGGSTEQVWGHPRARGGRFQGASSMGARLGKSSGEIGGRACGTSERVHGDAGEGRVRPAVRRRGLQVSARRPWPPRCRFRAAGFGVHVAVRREPRLGGIGLGSCGHRGPDVEAFCPVGPWSHPRRCCRHLPGGGTSDLRVFIAKRDWSLARPGGASSRWVMNCS